MLPEEVSAYAAQVKESWRGQVSPKTRALWQQTGDFHITLCFPGAIDERAWAGWREAVQPVAAQTGPLSVTLAAPSTFNQGRILFVGVQKTPELTALASHLEQAMSALGYAPETRAYTPHITLARSVRPPTLAEPEYEHTFPKWTASEFVLLQTLPPERRPNPGDLRYTIVHSFPFRQTK